MGQPLPLPKRVPKPLTEFMAQALLSAGIILNCNEDTEKYVEYTLPKGWCMVDNSWREDLPCFHILDEKGLIRFNVSGSWKGSCEDEIKFSINDTPKKILFQKLKVLFHQNNNFFFPLQI